MQEALFYNIEKTVLVNIVKHKPSPSHGPDTDWSMGHCSASKTELTQQWLSALQRTTVGSQLGQKIKDLLRGRALH